MAERDEARAEGYAEAARGVEQSVEIDRLREWLVGWVGWGGDRGLHAGHVSAGRHGVQIEGWG